MQSINTSKPDITNYDNVGEVIAFLNEAKYIILFYVIGDIITTHHALQYGFEENVFLAALLDQFGIGAILMAKFFFMLLAYWNYHQIRVSNDPWSPALWKVTKCLIAFAGLVLVINNTMVICGTCSLFQMIGLL